ncbi:Uncharacterised protein [Mycobacterium tuberculosis]|nr:Uncharacterised protein [Mycobacterium tuberculosis]
MMVVLKVSVPSRGFGSDDLSAGRDHESGVEGFPSPLVVLGLTTGRMSLGHSCHRRCVSVPSRGFGSDDRALDLYEAQMAY